jgi:hypothetical protein
MKVVAFAMIVCIVCLSIIPGKAKTMLPSVNGNHCQQMSKQSPCKPKQKNDCEQGMCNTMLSCAGCGFLKIDPVTVNPVIPVLMELPVTPYRMGDLSDYSNTNWNPP